MVFHICETCGKNFERKDHFIKHTQKRKKPCIKKNIIDDKDDVFEKITAENEILKKENLILKENRMLKENEELKEKEIEIIKENEELKEKIDIIKNNNTTIINNNINITNNFNVIKIIDHGKEDYTKINIEKILKDNNILPALNYISTVVYYIHCNDNFPEYQNIFIPDLSRNKASIYYNGKWKNVDKDTTMEKLFNSVINHIDDITEKNPNEYVNYENEIQQVITQGRLYSKRNKKGAINNVEGILYDNKQKIKNNKIKNLIQ